MLGQTYWHSTLEWFVRIEAWEGGGTNEGIVLRFTLRNVEYAQSDGLIISHFWVYTGRENFEIGGFYVGNRQVSSPITEINSDRLDCYFSGTEQIQAGTVEVTVIVPSSSSF